MGQNFDLAQDALGRFNTEAPPVFGEDLTRCPVEQLARP